MAAAIFLPTIPGKCWELAPQPRSMSWKFTGLPEQADRETDQSRPQPLPAHRGRERGGVITTFPRSFPQASFLDFGLRSFSCLPGGGWRVDQAGALGSYLLRRVSLGQLSCVCGPDQGPGFRLCWSTRRAGRSGLLSQFLPVRIGMRVPMAAGCGGHRMEPVAACWTRATNMAGWSSMPPACGPETSSSLCLRTSPGNGSKASRRTLCSSTNLAVRCALIPGSASTRWSSPMHILPPPA